MSIGNSMISGSINEEGFIKSLKRKGFNLNRCLSELIQNTIDAKSLNTKIEINENSDEINLIDDGNGMTKKELNNMWDTFRENHSGEESGGVSGLGSKPSTLIASKYTEVELYTKSTNGYYIKATIPWDKIIRENVYIGNIIIDNMNESDISMFKKHNNKTGTIIKFKYNAELSDAIKYQFKSPEKISDITQRMDCIFSNFPCCIKYTNNEEKDDIILRKYGYLNDIPDAYYLKTDNEITVFKMQNGEIIYARKENERKYKYYKRDRAGAYRSSDLVNWRSGTEVGNIIVVSGMRKDNNYFNFAQPIMPGASKQLLDYDCSYFNDKQSDGSGGDSIKFDLWAPGVVRNSQYIGPIKSLPRLNPNSGRAQGNMCLKCHHIRTRIEYNVNSSQDNIMDEIMGIQENKNQLNSHDMDQGFLRLIEDFMKETSDTIWGIFQNRVDAFNHVTTSEEEEEEEEDEEEEEEDEEEEEEDEEEEEEEEEEESNTTDLQENIVSDVELTSQNAICESLEEKNREEEDILKSMKKNEDKELNVNILNTLIEELYKLKELYPLEFGSAIKHIINS
jgi:hypothetical protein